MELKFVIPNMEKTFGNLEFAGEDKSYSEESTDSLPSCQEAITSNQMYNVQMILWWYFPLKLAKNILALKNV